MALSVDISRSPGCFAFAARTFTWVMAISRIPDRQAKKSRIPCPNFGESRFPGNSQIPSPVKIFCVFPNPAPYFGQIPDAENTLPDPESQSDQNMLLKYSNSSSDSHCGRTNSSNSPWKTTVSTNWWFPSQCQPWQRTLRKSGNDYTSHKCAGVNQKRLKKCSIRET